MVGALTWGAYEAVMLTVHILNAHGAALEALDENAFVTWYDGAAYPGGRWHGHHDTSTPTIDDSGAG